MHIVHICVDRYLIAVPAAATAIDIVRDIFRGR